MSEHTARSDVPPVYPCCEHCSGDIGGHNAPCSQCQTRLTPPGATS